MPSMSFATFLIICPTSFFLGILFSLFPYDYPLLWAPQPPPIPHLDLLEQHLRLLYHSPPLITQLFHLILGVGLLGLIIKLYKPSESNMLFDGGSLVLYMVAVIVYIANTVKGLRIVDVGIYGVGIENVTPEASADGTDGKARYDVDAGDSVMGREDNLKVLSASNTILALVLLGVLVLQVGQWYAEKADEKEKREFAAKEKEKKDAGAAVGAGAGGEVKRTPSSAKDKKKQ